jgi:gamma-glutamylcyclotransferase (GGCT)/AIG2-like uncharacterized protein YtfP
MLNNHLFLCGSLCKDMLHHKLIEDAVVQSTPATILGSMYRLEVGFPVYCSEGIDRIRGEMVRIKNTELVWPLLDQFFLYKEEKAEKCLYLREIKKVETEEGIKDAVVYGLNPVKKPRSARFIEGGDWWADYQRQVPLTQELSPEERQYIKKLGNCTGRDIVPYTPMTRELEKRGFVVDKGRRPALTKLGKEIFQFLI